MKHESQELEVERVLTNMLQTKDGRTRLTVNILEFALFPCCLEGLEYHYEGHIINL